MKKPAILSLLLAFAGSVVSAAPAKKETTERVSYTETDKSADADDHWVELASPTPTKHGRTFITVDARHSQLRIDAHKGRPIVKSVRVVYADGKQRVVKVGRKRSAVIDLDASRKIDHLVVDSDRRSKGTYTVHASSPSTGVATR